MVKRLFIIKNHDPDSENIYKIKEEVKGDSEQGFNRKKSKAWHNNIEDLKH